ncbi:polyhydroxyalkanoate granule-associated phasin [Asticcacaulis sp. YBE204]|uniref:polyhydroxyalkanoate granule-associated phasin n=1 Tax=Asticcacaulis sp. YBE204 TaxID=1282363 RepID=UPI0003C3C5FE|nr:polyhydroxyalkanoate granule-associated phasin [Asticcacaulis sp. YBE204]ESQ78825.1 hypothetical protein AEYBE204_12645 [Asticcacaulis sp. YBE204]
MTKLPLNPFFAWTALALKSSEMMTASAEVITHRMTRMANADLIPSAEDQKEFTLMGQEKMEAGTESMMAMGAYWLTLNHQIGAQALKNMMTIGNDMTSLASSTTPAQMMTRQAKLADSLTKGVMQAADMSSQAATMTDHGMKPMHSRAVANAKRLGKRGK